MNGVEAGLLPWTICSLQWPDELQLWIWPFLCPGVRPTERRPPALDCLHMRLPCSDVFCMYITVPFLCHSPFTVLILHTPALVHTHLHTPHFCTSPPIGSWIPTKHTDRTAHLNAILLPANSHTAPSVLQRCGLTALNLKQRSHSVRPGYSKAFPNIPATKPSLCTHSHWPYGSCLPIV